MTEQLLSVRMFAERLAISEVQARRLLARNVIGFVRLGRSLRVRAADVDTPVRHGLETTGRATNAQAVKLNNAPRT